uniref:Uncharacterized protein n=1 Tax=Anopheles atroparvus TaxID=41427 RepID=A0A182J1S7_ANOAO
MDSTCTRASSGLQVAGLHSSTSVAVAPSNSVGSAARLASSASVTGASSYNGARRCCPRRRSLVTGASLDGENDVGHDGWLRRQHNVARCLVS